MHKSGVVTFTLPGGSKLPIRAPVPEGPGEYWPIVKIPPGETFRSVILSDFMVSFFVHYVPSEERNYPCVKEIGDCPNCGKSSRKWQGYLACRAMTTWAKVIVPITRNAALSDPVLKGGQLNLCGRGISVSREGKHKRSRCVAKVGLGGLSEIPEGFKVTTHELISQLFHIWGVEVVVSGPFAPIKED